MQHFNKYQQQARGCQVSEQKDTAWAGFYTPDNFLYSARQACPFPSDTKTTFLNREERQLATVQIASVVKVRHLPCTTKQEHATPLRRLPLRRTLRKSHPRHCLPLF